MKAYDVAIIGAGPAGIMAAITASQNGKRVALIEKNAQIGRKLYATGNGRCNLTNSCVTVDRYHGSTPEFIETVINQFDQNATMRFFEDLGLLLKEEDNGRIFPRTNQASSVVEVLRQRLFELKVDIHLDSPVKDIEKSFIRKGFKPSPPAPSPLQGRGEVWKITTTNGKAFEAENLIIATGGRAANQFGSTGDGLYWAQKLGHTITPIYPALVPIETVETWPSDAQGIRVKAFVWATCDNKTISEKTGDVLFTSYGVSGTAVMALAGSIAPLLKTSQVQLHIDLFPDMTEKDLDQHLSHIFEHNGKRAIKDALVGLLPDKLIPIIINIAELGEFKQVGNIPKAKRLEIVDTLKNLTLTVSKLRPLKEAQVSAGGINNTEINPQTLESKLTQSLYFAGEILDVDGDSGGFNLQWSWSSGYVVGKID